MNERIRLLIEQATTYIDPIANDGVCWDFKVTTCWDFDKEKFAQLIVKECMSFQDEAGVYSKFDMADAIAQHFGVEE